MEGETPVRPEVMGPILLFLERRVRRGKRKSLGARVGKTRMVFVATESPEDIAWKRTEKWGYDGIVLCSS